MKRERFRDVDALLVDVPGEVLNLNDLTVFLEEFRLVFAVDEPVIHAITALAVRMDYGKSLLTTALIFENHIGGSGREIIAAKALCHGITTNDARWTFAEEHREQSKQGCLARTVFAIDGDVAADVQFGYSAGTVCVNEDDAE